MHRTVVRREVYFSNLIAPLVSGRAARHGAALRHRVSTSASGALHVAGGRAARFQNVQSAAAGTESTHTRLQGRFLAPVALHAVGVFEPGHAASEVAQAQKKAAIQASIRVIPDFPKPGIAFQDVSTLLLDPVAFQYAIDLLVDRYRDMDVQCVAGFEARGFLFGPPVALALGVPFVMLRKAGKLPGETVCEEYATEYSRDKIEMHTGAVKRGQRVLLVDDLVATGGTLMAGANLIRKVGGVVVEAACIIELPALGGRGNLRGLPLYTLLDNQA